MIPAEEARAFVLASCARVHPKALPLHDVLGCATSVPLDAPEDVPPFRNTAMDGYAVRAADTFGASAATPVRLEVAGLLAAGAAPTIEVAAGHAVRIMTGAAMPAGADAVVMVEETEADDDTVLVKLQVAPGDAVRAAGSDVTQGDRVFEPQTVIRPAHLGVLASLGFVRVPVYPRARVGVISTGDELVEGGGPLAPGQIRESNREMLLALVEQANCVPVDLGLAHDDKDEIAEVFGRGAEDCDALISSGGVSMGDFDLVKVVLDEIGDMRWMQIAIRPAKPFAFGLVGSKRTPGVRPARQPGVVARVVRAVRSSGAPSDDGSRRHRPASCHRGRRRRPPPRPGRQDALRPGDRPLRPRRPVPRCARSGPRARTSSPRPPLPMRWSCCPTATASRAALTSMPCC